MILLALILLAALPLAWFVVESRRKKRAHDRAMAMARHPAGKARLIPMHEWSYAQYKN